MRAAALALAAMMVGVMLLMTVVVVVSDCDRSRSALGFPHPAIRGEPMIAECRCSGASGRAPTAADRCPRHFAAGFICYKQLRVFLATIVL